MRTESSDPAPRGYGNRPEPEPEEKVERTAMPVAPPEPIVALRELVALLEVVAAHLPTAHHLTARIAALRASLG